MNCAVGCVCGGVQLEIGILYRVRLKHKTLIMIDDAARSCAQRPLHDTKQK